MQMRELERNVSTVQVKIQIENAGR